MNKKYLNTDMIFYALIIFVITIFSIIVYISGQKEKKYELKLWKPWLALDKNLISSIRLEPLDDEDITLSGVIEITDKEKIAAIKESMKRKKMSKKDGILLHWGSRTVIRLIAITSSRKYQFILFFHSTFPSVQYQILRPDKNKTRMGATGEGWRSAELCRIINEYIDNNTDNVYWKDRRLQ